MEQFKQKVMGAVDAVLADLGSSGGTMWMVVKPVVNLAKPQLEDLLDENPAEVYNWLKKAQEQIKQAIETYEHENNKV